jgi:hypothetical protein
MLNKLLSTLKDAHVPIAVMVFTVTSFWHFHTRVDLGANYTNSLYAMYAFLGGHAFVNRDKQDPPANGS